MRLTEPDLPGVSHPARDFSTEPALNEAEGIGMTERETRHSAVEGTDPRPPRGLPVKCHIVCKKALPAVLVHASSRVMSRY